MVWDYLDTLTFRRIIEQRDNLQQAVEPQQGKHAGDQQEKCRKSSEPGGEFGLFRLEDDL